MKGSKRILIRNTGVHPHILETNCPLNSAEEKIIEEKEISYYWPVDRHILHVSSYSEQKSCPKSAVVDPGVLFGF